MQVKVEQSLSHSFKLCKTVSPEVISPLKLIHWSRSAVKILRWSSSRILTHTSTAKITTVQPGQHGMVWSNAHCVCRVLVWLVRVGPHPSMLSWLHVPRLGLVRFQKQNRLNFQASTLKFYLNPTSKSQPLLSIRTLKKDYCAFTLSIDSRRATKIIGEL